ncbi:Qat anti-phage system associated protein QatB [Paenarthrobacter sp. NPDC057355]|uniref:Qat anti-phage system associated protein QatB n=1 Tax=Paenarthrobacter sp. NPDC057355 TaxID=3346105 RepID=UPI00363B35E6
MGTSKSSTGPSAHVPLVPPWADEVGSSTPDGASQQPLFDADISTLTSPIAPARRFGPARRNFGNFARLGNSTDLRRGLAYYVSTGYGGSKTFTRRMGGTAATGGRLGALLASGQTADGTTLHDLTLARGSDANAVMDAIVTAVRPEDGTQDGEASRRSVREALSDLLDRFPDADLFKLDDVQRSFVIERYAALDVYQRFFLDMGKVVIAAAGNTPSGLGRLREIREFIAQSVAASFRRIRGEKGTATSANIAELTQHALAQTFSIFEEYLD